MCRKSTCSVLSLAAFAILLSSNADRPSAFESQHQTRTVFASVVARDGTPVSDLTAADFEVKEGGKVREITRVTLAATPLRLHTIVSDAGTGAFQLGVLRLVQTLQGSAEYAFTSVLVQPERVTDFTDSAQRVGEAIQRLGKRSALTTGNQLMEAIEDALKSIAAPRRRAVLLVLRIGNEATSTISANTVRDALRRSGATMYVVSRSGASKAAPTTSAGASGTASEIAQRQMNDADLADTALNLNLVLSDGSRDSGGYQQEISLLTAVATLEQLAREIKNSYEITYVLPSGVAPSDRLQVTTKRKNVTVRAPQRIADLN
jgi:hypothetical protein